MGFVVSSETICRGLQVNARVILSRLKERAQTQRFFISYDNMNFYEKVRDQRLYNKAHIVNYTAGYVCFMNAADGSPLPHLNGNQVQREAFSSLVASDFLLDQVELNHRTAASRYIFGRALEQHFAPAMRKQKHVVNGKVMPKFFNWPMPLKDIRCSVRKADVILLPILPLNKASIAETVDILRCLVERLELSGIVEDTIVPIKGDYLTVRNVTRAIYWKQNEPDKLYRFSWVEPIAGLFHLQMNLLRLFFITFWGKSNDHYSLQRFHNVLVRKGISKKVKDFHACDNFFRTIVQAYIIALCMHHQSFTKIDDLQTWLSKDN